MIRSRQQPRRLAYRLLSLVVVAAVGVLAAGGVRRPPRAESIRTAGVLSQSNSKDGSAILTASNLKPGDSTSGAVTITNTGTLAGDFELNKSNLGDLLGPGGGALSGALDLLVQDVTDGRDIYHGALGAMPAQPLGSFTPGESHTYRFTVGLPERGAVDDQFAGATTSVQYNWVARADASPTPAPARPADPPVTSHPIVKNTGTPALKVRVPRRQRLLRQRGIYLLLRCDRTCNADVRVRLKAGVRAGSPPWRVRKALPAARWVRVLVRIPSRDRARLRALLRSAPSIRIIVTSRTTERVSAGK